MDFKQAQDFMNSMNDPIPAMVKALQGGHVLNLADTKRAEDSIETIRLWIANDQDRLKENCKFIGNFRLSADGKKILNQIETYKQWIEIIREGIKRAADTAAAATKEKTKVEARSALERAELAQARVKKHDQRVINAVVELARTLNYKPFGDVIYTMVSERKNYRAALNGLKKLGVKHDLEPLPDNELESAFVTLIGTVKRGVRR